MRDDFAAAAMRGDIIKTQNFETERGIYQLIFVNHDGAIFMYKHRNGELVECVNLSECKPCASYVIRDGMMRTV